MWREGEEVGDEGLRDRASDDGSCLMVFVEDRRVHVEVTSGRLEVRLDDVSVRADRLDLRVHSPSPRQPRPPSQRCPPL